MRVKLMMSLVTIHAQKNIQNVSEIRCYYLFEFKLDFLLRDIYFSFKRCLDVDWGELDQYVEAFSLYFKL